MKKSFPCYIRTAGIDEVGVGAIAGDIVSSAVILDSKFPIFGLQDSKKISLKKRLFLYEQIVKNAYSWSIGRVSCKEIDILRVSKAIELSMIRAINRLMIKPTFIFIDGVKTLNISIPNVSIIKGDNIVEEISAASIIAKVSRDNSMVILDKIFPKYGFLNHKGYCTSQHVCALKKYGFTKFHRRSYRLKLYQ
ncbi:Ribonuclease HII [Buchnera aphidicola (Anoecia corni)]|uniref:Ribonuclease HII n=1 Tax=Buchnera aphidicola (Anoecia corni) TaxID=2994477 RepID=A0AAT9IH23_9GAMM